MIFSIFRFFCTLRFQIFKYCPIITNHTSTESYLLAMHKSKKLTLMTGFVLHGHILSLVTAQHWSQVMIHLENVAIKMVFFPFLTAQPLCLWLRYLKGLHPLESENKPVRFRTAAGVWRARRCARRCYGVKAHGGASLLFTFLTFLTFLPSENATAATAFRNAF